MKRAVDGAAAAGLLAAALCAPPSATAQPTPWDRFRGAADQDQVAWLEQNLPAEEANRLLDLVGALSDPASAQLLGATFMADPSFHYLWGKGAVGARLDTTFLALATRPPPGPAGAVHVAYHTARLRHEVLAWVDRSSTFAAAFTGATLSLPARPTPPGWRITLDFRPAAAMLGLLARPDSAELAAFLDTPVMRALAAHRSQSFYEMVPTPDVVAANLRAAASDAPLDALYRYTFPVGLMHFADVRRNIDDYRRLVEELSVRAGRMESTVAARLAPYVPEGTRVERTVRFLFADGADGWGIGDVYAIDLEYFKDDVDRLLNTLLHETFHAAQDAVDPGRRAAPESAADSVFLTTLRAIFREGTATHVAPPRAIGEEEYRSQVAEGVRLLGAIHDAAYADTPDLDRARTLHARGVRGSGPFYWLGADMARHIERRLGTQALAGTLRSDGAGFVVTYRSAGGSMLPLAVMDTARSLMTGRPPG